MQSPAGRLHSLDYEKYAPRLPTTIKFLPDPLFGGVYHLRIPFQCVKDGWPDGILSMTSPRDGRIGVVWNRTLKLSYECRPFFSVFMQYIVANTNLSRTMSVFRECATLSRPI